MQGFRIFWGGFFIVFFGALTAVADEDPCAHITMEWLNAQAPMPVPNKIVLKKPQKGMCEVVLSINGELVPVYAGSDWILAGQMFAGRVQVTDATLAGLTGIREEERQKAEARRMILAEKQIVYIKNNITSLDAMAALTIGTGKEMVYLFTDPLCPHCKTALKGAMDIVKDHPGSAQFKVIVTSIFNNSRPYAEQVICNGWGAEQYLAQASDIKTDEIAGCAKATDIFKKTEELFPNIGLSGVPAFIAPASGWKVEGANITRLKELLKIK